MTTIVVLWPSNAYVQATLGIGSVNFRTMDFGGAFFNWSCCVLCVLSDTFVLRCILFMFCVRETDLGTMAFVAYFAPWLRIVHHVLRMYHAQCNMDATSLSKQH